MDVAIFDLDGTLWNTCTSCATAWNNVLSEQGIKFRTIRAEDIRSVAGKPHEECIDSVFASLSPEERELICEQSMLEDNRVIAEQGGEIYPGVLQGLHSLKARYQLGIVSNCQSGYIETFLDYLAVKTLFTDHECWGNTGNAKGENLAALISRNGFRAPVYIGDTGGDRDAAAYCGILFVQAAYGFEEPLDNCTKADSFDEVVKLLIE